MMMMMMTAFCGEEVLKGITELRESLSKFFTSLVEALKFLQNNGMTQAAVPPN
jgi:hypothetical protein